MWSHGLEDPTWSHGLEDPTWIHGLEDPIWSQALEDPTWRQDLGLFVFLHPLVADSPNPSHGCWDSHLEIQLCREGWEHE